MKKISIILFFLLSLTLYSRTGGISGGRGFSGRSGGGYARGYSGNNTSTRTGYGYTSQRTYSGTEYVKYRNDEYDIFYLIFILLLLPLPVYVIIKIKNRKNKKAEELLEEISIKDDLWSKEKIERIIEELYFKLAEAKINKDHESIKPYVANSFYIGFKQDIKTAVNLKHRYVIENIKIKEIKVVEVKDYEDDNKDTFSAYIEVNMLYMKLNSNNELLEGFEKPDNYKELWNFIRDVKSNSWKLKEIIYNPEKYIHSFKSFLEVKNNN